MTSKQKVVQIFKVLIVILIFFFLGRYTYFNAIELNISNYKINYIFIVISLLFSILFVINQSFIWYYITRKNNCNISFKKTILVRTYSGFGKYIPGKIFSYAMILYYYEKDLKPRSTVIYCLFIEMVTSVLASILVFIFSLFFIDIPAFMNYHWLPGILIIFLIILLNPKIIEYLSNTLLKIIKRDPIRINITFVQMLITVFFQALNFLIFGIFFTTLARAFYPILFTDYFYITGTTTMASLLGFLAIFVPAGLGVTEGILILVFKKIMPPFFAGIIALSSRLLLTFSEILIFAAVFIYFRFFNKEVISS